MAEDAWSQYLAWMRGAWQGEVAQVLEELRAWQAKLGAPPAGAPDHDPREVLSRTITDLEKNSTGVGTAGYNDKRRPGYHPMNSKGPGPKTYHVTLYALSAEPKFDTDRVTRADLLKAVEGITLAEATLTYSYERAAKPGGTPAEERR